MVPPTRRMRHNENGYSEMADVVEHCLRIDDSQKLSSSADCIILAGFFTRHDTIRNIEFSDIFDLIRKS